MPIVCRELGAPVETIDAATVGRDVITLLGVDATAVLLVNGGDLHVRRELEVVAPVPKVDTRVLGSLPEHVGTAPLEDTGIGQATLL